MAVALRWCLPFQTQAPRIPQLETFSWTGPISYQRTWRMLSFDYPDPLDFKSDAIPSVKHFVATILPIHLPSGKSVDPHYPRITGVMDSKRCQCLAQVLLHHQQTLQQMSIPEEQLSTEFPYRLNVHWADGKTWDYSFDVGVQGGERLKPFISDLQAAGMAEVEQQLKESSR